ncbi:acyltransferase [Oribacterium sp. NK2B42]|uniref:acyltransferase n=1 Tax=Oribacterium sp. NK2B42 TaxID=689781 RepID=UPI0005D1DCEF|nr:acyltransferase [Oribacterium sp. NK2B42]
MNWYRFKHTVGMYLCLTGNKRARYLKKHNVLYHIGDNCMTMFRHIPLYPKLISIGNNVWIASQVDFVNHDVIHRMLNNKYQKNDFQERIGVIDIKDNVFIGSNTTILPDVTIGSNTVIAAGSLVNKSIPGNGVYGGVPAKYICPLDDLIEKRRKTTKIEIEQSTKGGLSDKTVEVCWKRFREYERKNNNEQ